MNSVNFAFQLLVKRMSCRTTSSFGLSLGMCFMRKSHPPVAHGKTFAKSGNNCLSRLSNGEALPFSPCSSMSYRDWPSPLGSSGRADPSGHQSLVPSGEIVVTRDGGLSFSASKRLAQHHQSGCAVACKEAADGEAFPVRPVFLT